MRVEYYKRLTDEQAEKVRKISESCDILFDTAKLLFYRGIDSVEKAKAFLSPGLKGFNDPFKLKGVTDAVKRIVEAVELGQTILVFGDYDADGVCATTVLSRALKDFGASVLTSIPEREDGYGLNLEKIRQIHLENNLNLLITVDCGISDKDVIEEIKGLGVDVIVTDHHEPPEELPNCICINPHILGQEYPFNGLCGAGVAYKLAYALIGEKANNYLDFVALATVADSMELIEENRDIVSEGLKIFNSNKLRPAFKAMLGDGYASKNVTSQTLAYQIAPRINAGGRMGNANCALELFASENQNEIFDLAVKLNEYNIARQSECDAIYKQAKTKISQKERYSDDVILVYDEGWKTGFIGIVAARLVEEFGKPVIVFAGVDGYLKGSARSIDGINIYNAINSAKDILIAFGGHSQAAGISVEKQNFEILRAKLNEYVKNECEDISIERTIECAWKVEKTFSLRFSRELEKFEPFGVGNKKPLFTVEVESVKSSPLKSGSLHYSYKTEPLEMLDFNGENNVFELSLPVKKKIVFEPTYSVFKGKESVKGITKNIICDYGDFSSLKFFAFRNELINILNQDKIIESAKDKEIITACKDQQNIEISEGYGTIYALVNAKNVPQEIINNSKIKKYFLHPIQKGARNCLVVSLSEIPQAFNRVVYIDKPLYLHNENDCLDSSVKYLENIKTDRQTLAEIYGLLADMSGRNFTNSVSFYFENINEINMNAKQFIFATEVFIELGFFKSVNGVLKVENKQKTTLENSKIYRKIQSLTKGN